VVRKNPLFKSAWIDIQYTVGSYGQVALLSNPSTKLVYGPITIRQLKIWTIKRDSESLLYNKQL